MLQQTVFINKIGCYNEQFFMLFYGNFEYSFHKGKIVYAFREC